MSVAPQAVSDYRGKWKGMGLTDAQCDLLEQTADQHSRESGKDQKTAYAFIDGLVYGRFDWRAVVAVRHILMGELTGLPAVPG